MFMVGSLSVHFLKSLMQELRTFKKIGSTLFLVDYDGKKKPLLGATNNFKKLNYTKK